MNTCKFSLYDGTMWRDITKYINIGAKLSDTLDESLDNLSFTIPYIKADSIIGFDLSKTIPRYTPCKIELGDEIFRMFIANCTTSIVKKTEPILYSHDVTLIEVSKILQRNTIPNITVTQPKSVLFDGKYYSNIRPDIDVETGMTIGFNTVTPELTTINQSTNLDIIEDNILKANNDGSLSITLDIWNDQFNKEWNFGLNKYEFASVNLELYVYSNGNIIFNDTIYVPPASSKRESSFPYDYILDVPKQITYNKLIELDKLDVDQEITITFNTTGSYSYTYPLGSTLYEDKVRVTPYLYLSSQKTPSNEFIYLQDTINKILRLIEITDTNDSYFQKFQLDRDTEDKLIKLNKLSPEDTFENITPWEAIKKLAGVVNAIPEIGENDFRTITFRFLDEIPSVEFDSSMFNDRTESSTLDDYVSSLEINPSNLIEEDILNNTKIEPYDGGWLSTRANSEIVGQMNNDNSAFKVRQNIYRIYKMFIKGPGVKITNGSTTKTLYGTNSDNYNDLLTKSDNVYFDISDRVVEDQRWSVYGNGTANSSDGDRRTINTKGNHIHYKQGTKYINGLGYKTETLNDFIGTKAAPRALMETILSTVADYLDENDDLVGYQVVQPGTWQDLNFDGDPEEAFVDKHVLFDGILAQIHYMPMTSIRGRIHKNDIFDMGVNVTKYANEQDRMNDAVNLGTYMGNSVNKLGNVDIVYSGQKRDYNDIPRLGYKVDDNLVITSRNIIINKNFYDYTLNLSKDYINLNPYLAPNSAYRQYEIPQVDYVKRTDEYISYIALTEDKSLVTDDFTPLTVFGKQKTIQNFGTLGGMNNTPLSYGRISVKKDETTETPDVYDMSIDGLSTDKTVSLLLEFDSNYSVGPKKYNDTLGEISNPYKAQSYVMYTDFLGKAHSIDLSIHPKGFVNNSESDANNYPILNNETTDASNLNLSLIIDKDAREKYALNIQFTYISAQTDTIRVYPGIANYSGLIRNKNDIDVGVALLDKGYFPSIYQKTIDTSRINEYDNIGTIEYDSTRQIYGIYFANLNVPYNTYEGYVVYEKTTKDIIYAVKKDIPNGIYTTPTVWFIPKTHLKDRTIPLE